jgi:hypothetical protein
VGLLRSSLDLVRRRFNKVSSKIPTFMGAD